MTFYKQTEVWNVAVDMNYIEEYLPPYNSRPKIKSITSEKVDHVDLNQIVLSYGYITYYNIYLDKDECPDKISASIRATKIIKEYIHDTIDKYETQQKFLKTMNRELIYFNERQDNEYKTKRNRQREEDCL